MRPIDADTLKRGIEILCKDKRARISAATYFALVAFINKMPTIEAEPVKHGRLVNKGAGYVECSVCEQIYTNIAVLYKCCPYCTARFDGGVKDA